LKAIKTTTPVAKRYLLDTGCKLHSDLEALRSTFDWRKLALFDEDKLFRRLGYTAYATDGIKKIKPKSRIPDRLTQSVHIELAKNESESFQVVLLTRRKTTLTVIKVLLVDTMSQLLEKNLLRLTTQLKLKLDVVLQQTIVL